MSARRGLDAPLEREFDGLRALLAEDNEANQMVAIELLARLGIELDIAGNGREAVAMAQAAPDEVRRHPDGHADARARRARARRVLLRADRRFATVPIIAMTANAMKADLDACLAAGMNDHVTKPIDRKALVATVAPLAAVARPTRPRRSPVRAPPEPRASSGSIANPAPSIDTLSGLEGIDVTGTLQRLGIDRASLERMLLRFADGQGPMLDALRAAVAAGDAAAAARHAHAIAGAAGNLGADALRAAAKALEQAGTRGPDRSGRAPRCRRRSRRHRVQVDRDAAPPAAAPATSAERPFDRAVAGAALERLTPCPGRLRPVVGERCAGRSRQRPACRPGRRTNLGRLRRCVDGYEYDEARGIASRLLARVHGDNA